jgi:hypothetical protein
LRDPVEVIVGEPVAAQAQLPGQRPLAELFPPRGRVSADGGSVSHQARIWFAVTALALP